jgi:hypothetical protein
MNYDIILYPWVKVGKPENTETYSWGLLGPLEGPEAPGSSCNLCKFLRRNDLSWQLAATVQVVLKYSTPSAGGYKN